MKKNDEKWATAISAPPSIEVSTEGRVRKYVDGVNTEEVKLSIYNGLYCFNFNRATFQVHRLVAEAFIPNPEGFRVVKHIDGNKLNNSVSNLEWRKSSNNLENAKLWKTRLYCKELDTVFGSLHSAAFFTRIQPNIISESLREELRTGEDVKIFGLTFQAIKNDDESYDDYEVKYINFSDSYDIAKASGRLDQD